ncbi:MAG: META domain-containing protein [Hyphomicrobiaceae bacterium]|nr:MAG: META domain-containing protein [Hyphomicrobiaceae bacterium]
MRGVIFIGCWLAFMSAATVQAQVDPALEAATWHVLEIDGAPASYAETLQFSDHRVTGKAACNRFSAGMKQTGQLLEIGQPVATRMFCQGRMDEERRYFQALHAVRSFMLDDGGLVLNAADGHALLKLRK